MKKPKAEVASTPMQAVRTHVGLQKILDWAGKESGIDEDLQKAFDEGDALKLASIARYWVSSQGDTLPRLETWQRMNPLPYPYPITKDVYGKLFSDVGRMENGLQSYFKCRAEREGSDGLLLALDTTTFSTYSKNQIEARQGFNKDADGLDTIKLLVLYSVRNREPIAFSKQPGNIPDKISLENALHQLELLGLPAPVIVADNGFYSQGNMTHVARGHSKFLMLASSTDKWVRETIDDAREDLEHFDNACPFDLSIRGVTRTRMHEFSFTRQRSRGNYKKGETERFTRRLYAHVFFRPEAIPQQERRLLEELCSIKQDLEAGVEEFRPAAQRQIDRFLQVRRSARNVSVSYNMEAITEARRYWGYFVLVSNTVKDTFETLKDYRARERIEELFATYKEDFDGRKPRTWYPENLHGRQFAQFVGLGYHCFLTKRIHDVRDRLGVDTDGKTQEELALEKKLKTWIEQHSLVQILDWFRCVDYVEATGDKKAIKWTTEMTRRDNLFLKLLGVPL